MLKVDYFSPIFNLLIKAYAFFRLNCPLQTVVALLFLFAFFWLLFFAWLRLLHRAIQSPWLYRIARHMGKLGVRV